VHWPLVAVRESCQKTIECSVRPEAARIALCRADKISAVPFSSIRHVNITTPGPLHDACSASDLLIRLNGTEFDRYLGETRLAMELVCQLQGTNHMNATQKLHGLGQSLWLDNITRDLLTSGTLRRYIDQFSVTGLTSNPTIFDNDIKNSSAYDTSIREKALSGKEAEAIFFDLALEDITQAADLFRPTFDRTDGVDGWVSIEVSPLLAHNTSTTVTATKELFLRAARPNVFIKIPGTSEGVPAIEEAIFAGIPVNVTLLFSREHYLASAEAYLRGIERRIDAGLNPNVPSVASVFISRWDVAVMDNVPDMLRNRLGIAIAQRIYHAYNSLLDNERSRRIYNSGARAQRLLWASTGTKVPTASDILYVKALAAPFTVNTMPE
jgi:transaldolase